MPISKELKKASHKLPREIGRIVSQAGQAIQDLSDAESIMKIGEDIEQQGLSMMELAKKQLEEITTNVQANETPSPTNSSNNTNNVINNIPVQQDPIQPVPVQPAQEQQQLNVKDHSQDAEIVSIVSEEEYRSVDNLVEQEELLSISDSFDRIANTMLVHHENLKLTKRIAELEEKLIAKNQGIQSGQNNPDISSSTCTVNNEQVKESAEGTLHLVLRLK